MSDNTKQTIALLGDIMMTRSVSVFREPDYLRMREMLKSADIVFANFESCVHPYLEDAHQQRLGGGSYVTTEPSLVKDLLWLGINMVAAGSGHADDYGVKGIFDTMRYLDEAGIVHAGSGRHLAEARAPVYLDTPTGRVGLVATSGQFKGSSRAGDQRYDTLGHPGVNGFRHKEIFEVDSATLSELRDIGRRIGWEAELERRRNQGDPEKKSSADTYNFLGQTFRLGPKFAIKTEPNALDLSENVRQVKYARSMADRVIASFHGHEQGGDTLFTAKRRTDIEDIADYTLEYGRKCIDAGADIFVAHGPQAPMAVQVYNGKALLHGVGTFIFQIETMKYLPAEAYERYNLGDRATPGDFIQTRYQDGTKGHAGDPLQWEQVFAVCDFVGDRLAEIRVYPLDLGHKRSRAQRGRPIPARGEMADRILKRVQHLSAKYGTRVEIRDDVGIVKVD
ncbi:MAG TPA: CapA family protein [Beijerinckiaceae bacterium]|nr:CapA family protein [Beijerinckiaceae bacterium]